MSADAARAELPALRILSLALPGALAAVMALAVAPRSDWTDALAGGDYLLTGHLTVYADMPWVQMGPLSLLLAGLLPSPVYVLLVCALLPLLLWTAALPYPASGRNSMVTSVGGMLLAWPWAALAVQGHADDALVVVGVAGLVTGLKLRHEFWVVAGFVLAVIAKPTALMFLPLAFAYSRRAGLLAVAVGGVLWAPFVLADVPGFLAAGKGQGDLWPNSLPDLLGGIPHTGFPAWLRLVQLVGALLLCFLLARRSGPAAAVAGVFAFRVLLEPGTWNYYATSVVAAALLLDLERGWRVPRATIVAVMAFVVAFGDPPISVAAGLVRLAALGGVLAVAFASAWTSYPSRVTVVSAVDRF